MSNKSHEFTGNGIGYCTTCGVIAARHWRISLKIGRR